ncbi:imidazole glycerol phosphate synthase subunit HisH [Pseudoalteromonas spongiae]|uniref:imidazole glycerol phosphate synthase subunit HisH n=1 Tax=Pseudoalteromonas spongiae TaxID=298657 RepID=UPI00110A848F|nr:imidazole glycerol phosphate synthase subunit HisH [Pseudoalteromonas spongiae]TMO84627.1 imidazole glycerol phosphate synthase subunit HisH [Pseudoalteromonas spongiae]
MIAIINTGCANINSVRFAFERLGAQVEIITEPEKLNDFPRAVLPGVGHASVAMKRLIDNNWQDAIRNYKKPLLGICLGMQLMCDETEEGDVKTLALIPGKLNALQSECLTLPHMGWNNLDLKSDHPILAGINGNDQVYYVHSFAHVPNQYTLASSNYSAEFSAIIAKDNFIGMQFHPEKSARVGERLLKNFLAL